MQVIESRLSARVRLEDMSTWGCLWRVSGTMVAVVNDNHLLAA